MRLHYGAVPRRETAIPGGWTAIREPGPVLVQVVGLPLGVLIAAGLGWCWLRLVPLHYLALWEEIGLFAAVVLLIPVHEFLHALVHPTWGRESIIGVWPGRMLCYAHYEGEMSRGRFLLVFAMPLLVLTGLPFAWALVGQPSVVFGFTAALNALAAGGDMFCMGLLLWQVPRGARIWNDGWKTYFVGGRG